MEQSAAVERSSLRTNAKELGAYYTDDIVARFLVNWAVTSPTSKLLDPSFGGGAFLRAAAEVVTERGGAPSASVYGVELDPEVYEAVAKKMVREVGIHPDNLLRADFFSIDNGQLAPMDALVGNPPFIRYHSFSGSARSRALARAAAAGVKLSALSSSWAPFLIHGTTLLKHGGRLAMVAPMELAHAGYAMPVLGYLTKSFRELTIATFRTPLFPELSQDVVLLMADGYGQPHRHLGLIELNSATDLARLSDVRAAAKSLDPASLVAGSRRMSTYFLDPKASELYVELASSPSVGRLGELASVGIGYVTGANDFFHISVKEAIRLAFPEESLRRAVFRGRAFAGLRFTESDWKLASEVGTAGYLLSLDADEAGHPSIANYLKHGEARNVPERYKCRSRSPWYAVPGVHSPSAFLTYMSGLRPFLVANAASAVAPNSLHIVRLKEVAPVSADELATVWNSSLCLLSAEVEGHPMGGGMLKLEPSEARNVLIPLPGPKVLMDGVTDEVDRLVRAGRQDDATSLVNKAVLVDMLGLSMADSRLLQTAADDLKTRRYYRRP